MSCCRFVHLYEEIEILSSVQRKFLWNKNPILCTMKMIPETYHVMRFKKSADFSNLEWNIVDGCSWFQKLESHLTSDISIGAANKMYLKNNSSENCHKTLRKILMAELACVSFNFNK